MSTIPADDFTWHHLVGVCDQANGIIILYVDGKVAATASIAPGAGIIEASAPLTIGAAIASGQTDYGSVSALQWVGNIADVATYKYALSAGQVVNQYSQVPGTFVPVTFVTPQPLTNFAYQANQTPDDSNNSRRFGYPQLLLDQRNHWRCDRFRANQRPW